MKKIYLMLITGFTLSITAQSANMLCNNLSINQKALQHDHRRCNKSRKHNPQKDREREIEYRLDVLEAKYERDKDRLDNSYLDKQDKKMRKKELKYQYKREKERLKHEKERVKKGNFYSY